jgi:hypothetical protein
MRAGRLLLLCFAILGTLTACNDDSSITPTSDNPPVLITPEHQDIVILPVVLRWEADPADDVIRLQLSSTPDFASLIADEVLTDQSSFSMNDLTLGVEHYWRVGAVRGSDVVWSEVRSFTCVIPIVYGYSTCFFIAEHLDAEVEITEIRYNYETQQRDTTTRTEIRPIPKTGGSIGGSILGGYTFQGNDFHFWGHPQMGGTYRWELVAAFKPDHEAIKSVEFQFITDVFRGGSFTPDRYLSFTDTLKMTGSGLWEPLAGGSAYRLTGTDAIESFFSSMTYSGDGFHEQTGHDIRNQRMRLTRIVPRANAYIEMQFSNR